MRQLPRCASHANVDTQLLLDDETSNAYPPHLLQAEYDYDQHRGRFAMKIGEDGIRAGAYTASACFHMIVTLQHARTCSLADSPSAYHALRSALSLDSYPLCCSSRVVTVLLAKHCCHAMCGAKHSLWAVVPLMAPNCAWCAGQQITCAYNNGPNEVFLYRYGFVETGNPHDVYEAPSLLQRIRAVELIPHSRFQQLKDLDLEDALSPVRHTSELNPVDVSMGTCIH